LGITLFNSGYLIADRLPRPRRVFLIENLSGPFLFAPRTEDEMEGTIREGIQYKTRWIIRRYMNQEMFEAGIPSEVPDMKGPIGQMLPAESVIEGNLLLNEGIQAIEELITGISTPVKWDSGNARIGVGDNSLAANVTQTALQAVANNSAWLTMSANYPSRSNTTLTWQAAANANTANFGWQEFTVVNAANDTGNNINRVANNQGTKVLGQVWTVSVQITLS